MHYKRINLLKIKRQESFFFSRNILKNYNFLLSKQRILRKSTYKETKDFLVTSSVTLNLC